MITATEHRKLFNKHLAFFKSPTNITEVILDAGEFVECKQDDTLCDDNEIAQDLFFVLEGEVELEIPDQNNDYRPVVTLHELSGHFGWNEYQTYYDYRARVKSENAVLFKIHRDKLQNLFLNHKQLENQLFLYRLPLGSYLFFKSFNLPSFIAVSKEFLTSFELSFYEENEVIVKDGDEANHFYMIASGSAKVTKNENGTENIINLLEPEQFFGEIALLQEGTKRGANVIATSPLVLFSLTRLNFEEFLHTKEGRLIKKYLSERKQEYSVTETTFIGRAEECHLQIKGSRIAPKHAKLTRQKSGTSGFRYAVEPISSQFPVYVNKRLVTKKQLLDQHDELFVGSYKVIIDHKRHTIRAQEISYHSLQVSHLVHYFKDSKAIDNLSFSGESGEFICIMGPSGSGKSTLLSLISGANKQTSGSILYDHEPLYENLDFFRDIFGFIPQDDILRSELTVYENLYFAAKLREPLASKESLENKIDSILDLLKLSDRKFTVVGDQRQKVLSGGERKRLSIARELVSDPAVLFVDEPTSGLSAKDAEDVISLLAQLKDMGKLVLTVLHQPSAKLYKMFDKIILLDKGGRLVYTGPTEKCIPYMRGVVHKFSTYVRFDEDDNHPEVIFDILEYSEDHSGQRMFSPEFWHKSFLQIEGATAQLAPEEKETDGNKRPKAPKMTIFEHFKQFSMLMRQNFMLKIRNRNNVFTSILVPIGISLLVAFMLRFSPDPSKGYEFAANSQIPIYLFMAVIVSIFLGLTNSARDIVGEQVIYNHELKIKLQIRWYVISKFLILALFAAIQVFLFIAVGNYLLEIKGVLLPFFGYSYLAALCGVSLGLLLSSYFQTAETVLNWIPLILIPQIIFGGALIEFEEMNTQLFFNQAEQVIPEICQIMPSRWTFEALSVAQVRLNPFDKNINKANGIQTQITDLIKDYEAQDARGRTTISQELITTLDTFNTDMDKLVTKLTEETLDSDSRLTAIGELEDFIEQGLGIINPLTKVYPGDEEQTAVLIEHLETLLSIYQDTTEFIGEKYAPSIYHNDKLRDAVFDGSGDYTSRQERYLQNNQGFLFNSVFMAENKSFMFISDKKNKPSIWEISTLYFNAGVLSLMILTFLCLTTLTLQVKKNKTIG